MGLGNLNFTREPHRVALCSRPPTFRFGVDLGVAPPLLVGNNVVVKPQRTVLVDVESPLAFPAGGYLRSGVVGGPVRRRE